MQSDGTLHEMPKFSLAYRAKSVIQHGKRKSAFSLQPVAYVVVASADFPKNQGNRQRVLNLRLLASEPLSFEYGFVERAFLSFKRSA